VEWITSALAAFALVVPVELPDKTFVATLVLATRYRPLLVWIGVVLAFGVQCVIAVIAGQLLELLPARPVRLIAALLFAVAAVILFIGARAAGRHAEENELRFAARATGVRQGVRAVVFSFLVLFAAEWGDLSQLLTASLVAAGRPATSVFVGSWLGLMAVSGVAVLLGQVLLKRVPLSVVQYLAAAVCLALAAVTLFTTLR
jgi:putative Ca2+/H+ antiporter (TMEM165/GDT1 family)